MEPLDKLWWLRLAVAVAAGLLCALLGRAGGLPPEAAPLVAAAAYAATFAAAPLLGRGRRPSLREMATCCIFSYVLAWLTSWIFFYTLLTAAG